MGTMIPVNNQINIKQNDNNTLQSSNDLNEMLGERGPKTLEMDNEEDNQKSSKDGLDNRITNMLSKTNSKAFYKFNVV